jgi:GNAT superfamily N-acetyltransferase
MTGLDIRRLASTQWQLYKELRLSALKDAPQAFSTTHADAKARGDRAWARQVARSADGDDRATFVLLWNNKPSGLAAVYRERPGSSTGDVHQVWVAPALRSTGAAEKLMAHLETWAAGHRIRRLRAVVAEGNARARRFYRKIGYAPAGPASDSVLIREIPDL